MKCFSPNFKTNSRLMLAFGVLVLTFGVLIIPIPIRATVIEGEIECPPPIINVIKATRLNITFSVYNSTFQFFFHPNEDNVTIFAEAVEFRVYTFERDNGSRKAHAHVVLFMENCRFEGKDYRGYIGQLNLYVDLWLVEDTVMCRVDATSHVPVYEIIYNAIINLW